MKVIDIFTFNKQKKDVDDLEDDSEQTTPDDIEFIEPDASKKQRGIVEESISEQEEETTPQGYRITGIDAIADIDVPDNLDTRTHITLLLEEIDGIPVHAENWHEMFKSVTHTEVELQPFRFGVPNITMHFLPIEQVIQCYMSINDMTVSVERIKAFVQSTNEKYCDYDKIKQDEETVRQSIVREFQEKAAKIQF